MPSDVIKKVVRQCSEELRSRLPVDYLLTSLWCQDVISTDEKTSIETGANETIQRSTFTKVLMNKDNEDLDTLLKVLRAEGAYRGLVKILEESKTAVLAELMAEDDMDDENIDTISTTSSSHLC